MTPVVGPGLAVRVLDQARRHPAATAVADGERQLTYAELDRASAAVAVGLSESGVRPGDAVAISLPRSWRLVCAMLGILRLGATVVPLDSQSPAERRRYMLTDSASVALVCAESSLDEAPEGVAILAVGDLLAEFSNVNAISINTTLDDTDLVNTGLVNAGLVNAGQADAPGLAPGAAAMSFIFYTSGTTGAPKGVEVRDAGVLRLAEPGYISFAEGARFACLANPAFDAISFEVWAPLLTGGCCVIFGEEVVQTPHLLAQAMVSERIDTLFITTALFNAVVDTVPDCFASIGQVLVGGEQLNAHLIRRWYRDNPSSPTRLHNVYGPTETTTFALCHPISRDFAGDVVPIGVELAGTTALLLVDGARLAEPGEQAELFLGGEAVAVGYRNLPEETAARFVGLPWYDGGAQRFYRTGDLVRRDEEGRIEYVGRADRQVKVRGFRIEPGELERQIVAHPAVRQAFVCTARHPVHGVNELLAYVVLGAPLSFSEFDRHLTASLPAYMRPHHVFLVEMLPLNANGKVDQEALFSRDDTPWRPEALAVPVAMSSLDRAVLAVARGVLGVADLRLDDRWIASGGDSLKALRLRFAVRQQWGCELPQALVLHGDIASVADAVSASLAGLSTEESGYPEPAAPGGADTGLATSEQQRMWLIQQQDPNSVAYNVGLAFELSGTVDVAALRRALSRVVERFASLRSAFAPGVDGLLQVVGPPYDPWIALADAAHLDATQVDAEQVDAGAGGWRRSAQQLFARPFDLSVPRMLQAAWLGKDSDGVLLLHLHHIAVDGWSLSLLFAALSEEYRAALGAQPRLAETTLEPRPVPAGLTALDFARWQANWFATPTYLAQRDWLRDYYAGLSSVAEPLEPLVAADGAGAARLLEVSLDVGKRAALDRLGAELGLTRFEILLTIFSFSIYSVTGRACPRIASPVANRPVREFADSVGMFANTVLVPMDLDGRKDLRALLLEQAALVRHVIQRQDVALADVVADQAWPRGAALFDFMFVLENTNFAALELPGCQIHPVWLAPARTKCAATLCVVEHDRGLDCLWEYDDSFLSPRQVRAMAAAFRQALDWLAQGRTEALAELASRYRGAFPAAGRGAVAALAHPSVAEAFAHQARLTPTATALVLGERRLSYGELDGYAEGLAEQLRPTLPTDPAQPCCVALFLEASLEHVVALLALARLNITIIPLDPQYPPALLRQILDQIEPICVLVAPGTEPGLDLLDPDRQLPRQLVALTAPTKPPLESPVSHGGLRPLYTLFTSGSTGAPKGVQVSDRILANLLQWQREAGDLPAGATTMQFSMLSFDVSFQEIFGTLCGGGCLHLIRPQWRQDLPALLDYMDSVGIERVFMPYVALQLLAEHGVAQRRFPGRLRDVVTAGEQLICTRSIRNWFAEMPRARLFNHYGPTETHVVTSLRLDGDPELWPARPAIGAPIANALLCVVDGADLPLPPECPGELLIGGAFVQPCYLGDPDRDRARFVELPGLGHFFRSGDRARFGEDGLLHYLGRDDQQIKLSGHRLELGQVEAALLTHPRVVNAVVIADGQSLVACVQLRGEEQAGGLMTVAELNAHLAPLLPAYVRIDRLRLLSRLPRTASGKLDRRRVLAVTAEEPRPIASAAALTAREAQLAAVFAAVVGSPIGADQSFFDAGASSLSLMRFHLRCTAELGLPFTIADLFEHVSIRRLARFLDERIAPSAMPIVGGTGIEIAEPIAIIAMAVRAPGAPNLASFWAMVVAGASGIEYFDAPAGLVGARSQLDGLLAFDPAHFGISAAEARLMDPQQRHLLMGCVEALSHAGIPELAGQRVGLIASCGENTYFQAMLREADPAHLPDSFQLALHHEKDFLATKVAFHLGLTGPALTVQSACSSSLAAVHIATGMLRQGEADLMMVGGVLVDPLLADGYQYRPQHIFSPDGHCRPFSDNAGGTIGGSGVGVVILKPLRHALRDGNPVYAVIAGSALNNDGAGKLSYSAPSLAGQREVIVDALSRSGHSGADLGYVEAHGTATQLGDPVEVNALRQAFDLTESSRCALASVKSQIGHLGAAAGVVGLIRAALAVHHDVIPPNVDFRRMSPQIGADPTPFYVPTRARPWPAGRRRVAAVSSFGIGGTNAHLILRAADPPAIAAPAPIGSAGCLLLSSSSEAGLRADAAGIADYLTRYPQSYPAVLRHLQSGRPAHSWRMAAVCGGPVDATAWLRSGEARRVVATTAVLPAEGATDISIVDAFLAGQAIRWPGSPAAAPWDFPPPAFDLADYDFVRPAEQAWPKRVPESEWLHQPHWVRLSRAAVDSAALSGGVAPAPHRRVLVVMTERPLAPEVLQPLEGLYSRVVRVSVGTAPAGDDVYELDPADPAALKGLLDAIGDPALAGDTGDYRGDGRGGGDGEVELIDWLHGLPLSVGGQVSEQTVARAGWACLDTTAALLQAATAAGQAPRLRLWWLSYQAQAVDGAVRRPELGLLAGASAVAPQESAVTGHWLDLPSADPVDWIGLLPALLAADGDVLPRRLALRQGYWWRPTMLPVEAAPLPRRTVPAGAYLILGGTGGIGRSVAAWLLTSADCRVTLLARRAELPQELVPWRERIDLIEADLAAETVAAIVSRLDHTRFDGVVHAVGVAAGALISGRATAGAATAVLTEVKLAGALVVEALVERQRPAVVVYCSSMAAQFGGIGQFDYAAANGVLDGFASYRGAPDETTARVTIDWDIWRDVGMAQQALATDARHQAHLAVGLTAAEGQRLFARAMRLQLPHLHVSTTGIDQVERFYASVADRLAGVVKSGGLMVSAVDGPAGATGAAADQLSHWLRHWLGVDQLDPSDSLYDLGADSLTLLSLIDEVRARFGVDLSLSQLSHRVSLAEVVALLGKARVGAPTDSVPEIEVWQVGSGRDLLCLLHPVGGDIQAYRELVAKLDSRLTVCLIADPALFRPSAQSWPLPERARRYSQALQARFPRSDWRWRLGGWSFGAWTALAMAADAEAAEDPIDELYLLDPPPPEAGPRLQAYDDSQLEAVFAYELAGVYPLAGAGGAVAARKDAAARSYAEGLARCCRANVASMADYAPPRLAMTRCRLWLASEETPGLPRLGSGTAQLGQWQKLLPRLETWQALDTTHYGIVQPPQVLSVVAAINAVVATC